MSRLENYDICERIKKDGISWPKLTALYTSNYMQLYPPWKERKFQASILMLLEEKSLRPGRATWTQLVWPSARTTTVLSVTEEPQCILSLDWEARQRPHSFLWSNIKSHGGSLPLHSSHWDRVTKSSLYSRREESDFTPQWEKCQRIFRTVLKTTLVHSLAAHVHIPLMWKLPALSLSRHLPLPQFYLLLYQA